ncbi:cytochrome c3 family protein [Neobacillus massiliamazoniensis]|uniref:Doubled CXXCH motif (Paired_CXXCH_1) n=1 Tax=Neobacillus massiliamazoniensis TaxID=1499688 RepID=A0A0U1NTN5_9BACI|nr:cytochrome c3 family protein [Neobacillus massiliamazoniensis]CRK81396.1 Doubled CXXCH motif (Paired_CXXCH_1) [Neobacillus massiliamazoniensis]
MSKIKMSFSLILAIFLVGILSTAAFAKDPYGLKPVQSGLGFSVPFTGNSADAADIAGRSFDLVLQNGATVVKTYTATLDGSKKGTVTIPASDITPGTVYTLNLYHSDDTAHATLLSKSTAVATDGHNDPMLNTNNPTSKVNADGQTITIDKDGNGLVNANQTGYNNTRKNRSGQKVHGFYQNNTNSCASCHQTHTAANGESLLFKDGVYSTCSACHDGTTGAYNSFAPVSKDTASSVSGTFNVQAAGHNGSLHEADGSLKVAAAPGGNSDSNSKQFGQEFDCASCHAAHGAGSASENNLNIDPLGWGSVAYGTSSNDAKNGKLFNNIQIADRSALPTSMSTPYILVKFTATATDASNFWYSRAGVKQDDLVIQTYRWTNTKYVPDYSLWLRELGYPYKANTVLKDAANKDLTMDPNLTIVWRDGFAFGPSVANIASANVSIGIDVETTTNIATLFDNTAAGYIPDSGTEMSKYCASCHVDYLSITRTDNTGVYSQAHRHATAQDSLTCVRCHYAHGSEAQIMKDANDNSYFDLTAPGKVFDTAVAGNDAKAISYFVDPNPSSALKRYTGMSVCFACHGKGEQFIGNPNSNAKDKTTGEFLKGGNPGSTRTDISK